MGREIKFRGMTLNGEWVYGLVAHITASTRGVERGWFISNSVGMSCAYAVRPETVAQFTGLKDKNGVEIYEGDFIGLGSVNGVQLLGEVEFHDGCFLIHIEGFGLHSLNRSLMCDPIYTNTGTVLGNIHENPELLGIGAASPGAKGDRRDEHTD